MKVTINNFRCFRTPTEISIEDGKLYLLKGQSGAGKTTIFESIRWCLFGNMRNIYPVGFTPAYGGSLKGTNKTYISIEYKNLVIIRSQAPEQLRVSILGAEGTENELSQDSGQKYIDCIFGNKNVWMASSFIRQNERCPLMVASNTERMSLLNEILFGNENSSEFENPEFYVEKIDEELSKIDKDITAKTAVFNSHYVKYVESIKHFTNPYNWTEMSDDYIAKIEQSINQFKEVISSLSTQLIEVSKLEARKKLLFEKLNSFGQINEQSSLIQSRIDNFYTRRNELADSLLTLKTNLSKGASIQAKFSTLMEELNEAKKELTLYKIPAENVQSLSEKIKEFKINLQKTQSNENMFAQLQRQEQSIKEELENATGQRSQYDSIINNRSIETIQNIIRNTTIYNKIQELHSKILSLSIDVTNITLKEMLSSKKESLSKEYNQSQFIERLLNKYNLNRSFSISEKKEAYTEALKKHDLQRDHLHRKAQADAVKTNIDSLSKQKITTESVLSEQEIDEQIKSIERRMGAPLKCPNCQCTLEYKNDTLVKPEAELISKEEGSAKIALLRQSKNALIFNKSIDLKITTLTAQLEMIIYDAKLCSENVLDANTIGIMKTFLLDFQSFDSIPEESSQDIANKIAYLDKTEQYYKLADEYKTLSANFDSNIGIDNNIDELSKAVSNVPMIESRINRLQNTLAETNEKIKGIFIPVSSHSIQVSLQELTQQYNEAVSYDLVNTKIQRLGSDITKIDLSQYDTITLQLNIESNEKEIKEIDENILKDKSLYTKVLEYEDAKKNYEEIIIESSEDVISNALETNQITYNDLLQQHSQARYMLSLLSNRKELEVLQVELMTMTTKQANLNKLKSIITDVTNSALQDLVDNINTITNSILEELFDCGISIELKLYKEIKNKTKTKPYVNIIVIKDGEDFDIGALSGGEQSRVSLALTMALSSLHISPLIFIDEGLSALDEDRKHDCIEIMRKYLTPNKNVVNIEHSGTEAFYDNVITLGCC